MLQDLHDSDLAALAARSGDNRAFGELARRHVARVRALLRRMGATPSMADDVAQEAFVVAFERIGSYRNEGPFHAWIGRIAARLYVRRWKIESRIEIGVDHPHAHSQVEADNEHETIDLDRALLSLSPAERLCVSLCHGAGWSHAEIAEQLDMPVGTVKSHVRRGIEKLRTRLGATSAASAASAARIDSNER